MLAMRVFCWDDLFVYTQCCNTALYGPGGLDLCFQQAFVSYEYCCPVPEDLTNPAVWDTAQWVNSWWTETEKRGCKSRFYWLPSAVATTLHFGSTYHPRSGDVLEDNAANASASKESLQGTLKEHLERTQDFGFSAFLRAVRRYYELGELHVSLMQMANEILIRFGSALHECAEAAILAAFLKIESIFDRDRSGGLKFSDKLNTLVGQAYVYQRVKAPNDWDVRYALQRVDVLRRRPKLKRPLVVDVVLPLCNVADVGAAAASLATALDPLPEMTRLSPHSFKARLQLQVYDTCGLLAHSFAAPRRNISATLLAGLSPGALQFLGGRSAGVLPEVEVLPMEEEVPAGDLTAYIHHLAVASEAGRLADVTLLFHADFAEHIRTWQLDLLLGGMASGSYPHDEVDFLYLGWRHEGPVQGARVASTMRWHCHVGGKRVGPCAGHSAQPLAKDARWGDFNPVLFENMWLRTFGCPFDPIADDFGGYDFSQLLVSRRAAQSRPSFFWKKLARAITDRSSFQFLPGTDFISRRVDLSPHYGFNKGVSIWFEHMWHLLFDPRFFPERPDAGSHRGSGRDLRYFTRLGDPKMSLGIRLGGAGPDSIMLRHYWLSADEQCALFKDRQGCHLARLAAHGVLPNGRV